MKRPKLEISNLSMIGNKVITIEEAEILLKGFHNYMIKIDNYASYLEGVIAGTNSEKEEIEHIPKPPCETCENNRHHESKIRCNKQFTDKHGRELFFMSTCKYSTQEQLLVLGTPTFTKKIKADYKELLKKSHDE